MDKEEKEMMSILTSKLKALEKVTVLNYYMLKAVMNNQDSNKKLIAFDNDKTENLIKTIKIIIDDLNQMNKYIEAKNGNIVKKSR